MDHVRNITTAFDQCWVDLGMPELFSSHDSPSEFVKRHQTKTAGAYFVDDDCSSCSSDYEPIPAEPAMNRFIVATGAGNPDKTLLAKKPESQSVDATGAGDPDKTLLSFMTGAGNPDKTLLAKKPESQSVIVESLGDYIATVKSGPGLDHYTVATERFVYPTRAMAEDTGIPYNTIAIE